MSLSFRGVYGNTHSVEGHREQRKQRQATGGNHHEKQDQLCGTHAAERLPAHGKTTYDGGFIYEREWRKTTDLAWYGEKESTYRIEGYESYGTPIIRLYENDRPLGMRDYSSPKRAINAIREILRCAGYTM